MGHRGEGLRIACVSASNTGLPEEKSTSIRVCNKIREMVTDMGMPEAVIEILPLRDYDLKPCTLCGACSKSGECVYDGEFNKVRMALEHAQGIFLVIPHYSPIPSKLLMLLEKINEITYGGWINDPDYQSPFCGKPIGIIGHGGMAESAEVLRYYHDQLVTPVANTLRSLSLRVIGPGGDYPGGAVFGLKDDNCIRKTQQGVFPEIIQDWPVIEERIRPLVNNVIKEIKAQ